MIARVMYSFGCGDAALCIISNSKPNTEGAMIRWTILFPSLFCLSLLTTGPAAWARGAYHRLPEGQRLMGIPQGAMAQLGDSATTEPTPPSKGEPSAENSDEPGGRPAGEPPGKKEDEPLRGSATEPTPAPIILARTGSDVTYGAGFQFRGLFVPAWFLNAFLDASTPLSSVSLGAEFVRRRGNFDLVGSINFGFYSPRDGNYLGNGKNPAVDSDYIQFRNLNLLAFDVAFIWHHDFNQWLSLVYGAGLGFGVVLGDIYRISNLSCTPENVTDINQCYPKGMDLANREKWLTDHTGTGPDSPDNPHLYPEDGVWPVVPIVHLLLGVNFKISEQFSVRVDGGFHNAFYLGATGHYFF